MVVLMFGPPGCGKGTQARMIVDTLHIPAISTGDLLRAEMSAGTPLGKQAQKVMAEGALMSDDLVNQMLVKRIAQPDCLNGFLLDGYPRTLEQAEFVDQLFKRKAITPVLAFHLDVHDDILVDRICARRSCPECGRIYNLVFQKPRIETLCDDCGCGLSRRKDDCCTVARARLEAYHALTGPAIEHFRKQRFHALDGAKTPKEIFAELEKVLEAELVTA